MKRSILVATFLVTAAGVASANLLSSASPSSQAAPPMAQPVAKAPVVKAQVVPVASPAAEQPPTVAVPVVKPAAPAPAPTVQKVSVEARQAPVPFQMKPRPPVNVPAADAKDAKADAAKPGEAPADQMAAADGFNENAARAAIEADGYKSVKVLRKGANGAWQATAMRGKTPVTLTVDASGSVSAD